MANGTELASESTFGGGEPPRALMSREQSAHLTGVTFPHVEHDIAEHEGVGPFVGAGVFLRTYAVIAEMY